MQFILMEDCKPKTSLARTNYNAIKKDDGVFESNNMSVGFARFDKSLGAMKPHVHSEEGMYVINCSKAYARFGNSESTLGGRKKILSGMIMKVNAGEWHVFELDEGGFLDIVWFFPGKMEWDQT